MALYELKVFQEYFGQKCVTVFNYVGTGVPASVTGSYALVAALGFIPADPPPGDNFFTAWQDRVSDGVIFREVICKNIYDDDDFYVTPFPANTIGVITGTASSPMTAFGFQTTRVKQSIRRGNKRFVGVTEEHLVAGGIIDPANVANFTFWADRLSETQPYDDAGNALSFSPAIVSKEKYVTPSGKTAYKYYSTEVQQLARIAQGMSYFYIEAIRSQTSRQYGRGQ